MTAFYENGRTVVAIPARFTAAQERQWVERMVERLERKQRRPSDADLAGRAASLSDRYLDGRAVPRSVSWVSNQNSRWGSCTPATATIRISDQLRGVPAWVLDYVLVHELVHLLVRGHGPDFWALVERYPRTERARGFLDGFAHARRLPEHGVEDPDGATDGDVDDGAVDDGAVDDGAVDDGAVDDGAVDDHAGAGRGKPAARPEGRPDQPALMLDGVAVGE